MTTTVAKLLDNCQALLDFDRRQPVSRPNLFVICSFCSRVKPTHNSMHTGRSSVSSSWSTRANFKLRVRLEAHVIATVAPSAGWLEEDNGPSQPTARAIRKLEEQFNDEVWQLHSLPSDLESTKVDAQLSTFSSVVVCACPFPSPCAPADVAANLTFLATIVQRVLLLGLGENGTILSRCSGLPRGNHERARERDNRRLEVAGL